MYKFIFKRFFDLVGAILLLPGFLIVLVVFGPIIYFQDKGTVFYNADRLGKMAKCLKCISFVL